MISMRKQISLKIRIFIFFFGILTLMLCTYIFAISRFITRFTEKQLNADYEAILNDTTDTIQSLLWNLTLTAEQLLVNETIQNCLISYHETKNPYARLDSYSELRDTINTLTMANSDIALTYFYNPDTQEYIYSSLPVDPQTWDLPVIFQNSAYSFYGPCTSQSRFIGNPVLILNRIEEIIPGNIITLSVESGYYSLDGPLQTAERKSAYLILTNYLGEVIFSTVPETEDPKDILLRLSDGFDHEFRSFSKKSAQGWSVHVIIPDSVYTRDYHVALRDFLILSVLIIVLAAAFAMYFWQTIYHPLRLFDSQLSRILSDDIPSDQMHSSIPEYDHLLQKIVLLQEQIRDMIQKTIAQEQLNTKVQLEKLRAQINPHFLINTLNTLHWMALMNDQKEIDQITQSLSHLLSYNLDRESYSTSLKNEISSLNEYVILQKIRYTFHFSINYEHPLEDLNYPCPKFILQPLVENALSHGYREEMDIFLNISVGERIQLQIRDTGSGMTEETLQRLQELSLSVTTPASLTPASENRQISFGIGLQYVVQVLNDFYNGDYFWKIESKLGEGSTITMEIPKLRGEGYHAENTNH